jgi:hypothetical protein
VSQKTVVCATARMRRSFIGFYTLGMARIPQSG